MDPEQTPPRENIETAPTSEELQQKLKSIYNLLPQAGYYERKKEIGIPVAEYTEVATVALHKLEEILPLSDTTPFFQHVTEELFRGDFLLGVDKTDEGKNDPHSLYSILGLTDENSSGFFFLDTKGKAKIEQDLYQEMKRRVKETRQQAILDYLKYYDLRRFHQSENTAASEGGIATISSPTSSPMVYRQTIKELLRSAHLNRMGYSSDTQDLKQWAQEFETKYGEPIEVEE